MTRLNDGGTIDIDTGGNTMTLDDSALTNGDSGGATLNWVSGKIVLSDGGSITNDDGDGATFTVGSGDMVTLDSSGGSVSGTITNEGSIYWASTSMTALSNIDNSAGAVVFAANVDLSGLTLSGGDYEVLAGYTASNTDVLTLSDANFTVESGATMDIGETVSITSATMTVDSGATVNWTNGNIALHGYGNFYNYGTLTITNTSRVYGGVDAENPNYIDYNSLGQSAALETEALADAAADTVPDYPDAPGPYDWSAVMNIFTTDGKHNTAGWWGDTDLTAIPYSINSNGVLVTPRDMILAYHESPSLGDEVDFLGSDNVLYRRYFEALTRVPDTDILIATLNADLPSTVTPLDLMPADFTNYLPSFDLMYQSPPNPPVIFTNQDRTLLIGQYQKAPVNQSYNEEGGIPAYVEAYDVWYEPWSDPSDPTLGKFYYPGRSGDSGSPVTMLVNNKLVLLGCGHVSLDVPNDAEYIPQINCAIACNATKLSTYDGGAYAEATTYTVSTVDLSNFTDYSALE